MLGRGAGQQSEEPKEKSSLSLSTQVQESQVSQRHSGAPKAPASSKLPPGPGLEARLEFTRIVGLREGSSRAAGLCLPIFDNSGYCVSKNTSKQEHFPEGALALGTSGSFWLGWPRAASAEGRWEDHRAVRPAGALHASLCSCSEDCLLFLSPRHPGKGASTQRAQVREPSAAKPRAPPGSPADNHGGSARKMSMGDIAPGNRSLPL